MIRAVTGHFTSMEQAALAAGELRRSGFDPDTISQQQLADGGVALTVLAGSRETGAIQAMSRHGAEAIEKQEGQEIGDISNAPREGDNAPVITEPADAVRVRTHVRWTPEEQSPFEQQNRAQTTGQYYDMMRTESDDGTVPPTVHREAVTAPPTADLDRTIPGARTSSTGAPAIDPPPYGSRRPETPLQEFAARGGMEPSTPPDRVHVMQARAMIQDPVPSSAVDARRQIRSDDRQTRPMQQRSTEMANTKDRNSAVNDSSVPIFPPETANEEPTDSNPVPLSPTQPERRTSDGSHEPVAEPAIFALPAGNQAGVGSGGTAAGIAGIGVVQNPGNAQKRAARAQPGEESANPLSTSLDRKPLSKKSDR